MTFKTGDKIEVIDLLVAPFPLRGEIVEMDEKFMGDSYAKIRADSSALPPPEVWVNLRLAKKI